jgi:phosphonopyruvate decarboxylase
METMSIAERMLFSLKLHNVKWLIVVPGSGLDVVYNYYEAQGRCIYATREEEAIAIAAGLVLGGEQPLVLMQQTGVGNALNAVFSLAEAYNIFFPIIVCDRSGEDPNLVQRTSSINTNLVLQNLKCVQINWSAQTASNEFGQFLKEQQRWIVCTIVGKK